MWCCTQWIHPSVETSASVRSLACDGLVIGVSCVCACMRFSMQWFHPLYKHPEDVNGVQSQH